MSGRKHEEPFACPVCGAEVPAGRPACPECGADERTGWGDDGGTDGLDLPGGDDFDYEQFLRDEGLGGKRPNRGGVRWYWWVLAFVVLIAIVFRRVL